MELTKIQFEDGQKVSDAYVEINGVKHPVVKAQYQGKTPLSARNLNKMQENMETAISDLDERVVSYRNVLVDEQTLIKECGGLKLKKLNKLEGKTEQEVREGYNLLNIQDKEQTLNGVTVKCKNGVITLNGTSNASEKFNIDFPLVSNVPIGTYSFIPLGRDLSKYDYWLFNTNYKYSYYATSGGSNVINQEQNSELTHFYLAIKPNVTFNNHIIKPLLVTDTYTSEEQFPPFEQYGKAPTPDFPSEVKTVTGDIEVSVSNKNFAYDVIYQSTNKIYNPVATTSYKLLKDAYYIVSVNTENTGASIYTNSGTQYGVVRISSYMQKCDGNKKHWIIKALDNKEHKNINLVNKENDDSIYTGYCSNLMIEKIPATTDAEALTYLPTDYVEHQSQIKPLTLGDIELCKIGDYADYIYKNGSKWFKRSYRERLYITSSSNVVQKTTVNGNSRFVIGTSGKAFNSKDNSTLNKIYSNVALADTGHNVYMENNGVAYNNSGNQILMYLEETKNMTADEFKAYCEEKGVYVDYMLATPTDTEITDTTLIAQLNALENAMLYEGITNISITGDNLTPIADIDYWTWFKGEDSSNVYSTEEQVVGKWIDGKSIYRKVITGTLANADNMNMIIGTNIQKFINIYGFVDLGSRTPINVYWTDALKSITQQNMSNPNRLDIYYGTAFKNYPFEITVEYTKTTDV